MSPLQVNHSLSILLSIISRLLCILSLFCCFIFFQVHFFETSKSRLSLIYFHSRIYFPSRGLDPSYSDKPDHYQESTEIIASLENLNSEIREIWGVLNKRQDTNIPPPPTLMYSYLRWLRFHHLAAESNNIQGEQRKSE